MKNDLVIKNDMSKASKTGNWSFMRPEIDKNKCTGCGNCVSYCPEATIIVECETQNAKRNGEKSPTLRVPRYAKIDYDFCKGCGVCAQICPMKAITMKKK